MALCFAFPVHLPGTSKLGTIVSRFSHQTRMSVPKNDEQFRGFGEKKTPKPPSAAQLRREAAAARFDKMKAAGMPEYSVWVRLKDPPRPPGMEDDPDFPPMPWLPAGSMSVPRSSQVSEAIFEAEDDLLQGVYRLYPNMTKEPVENIEYGYQLKEFPDEDIRTAERLVEGGFQGMLRNFFGKLQNPLNPGD